MRRTKPSLDNLLFSSHLKQCRQSRADASFLVLVCEKCPEIPLQNRKKERTGCCHNSYNHIPLRKISTLFIHRAKQINLYISKDTVSAFIFTFIFFLEFFFKYNFRFRAQYETQQQRNSSDSMHDLQIVEANTASTPATVFAIHSQ